jgi:hypothetical protein
LHGEQSQGAGAEREGQRCSEKELLHDNPLSAGLHAPLQMGRGNRIKGSMGRASIQWDKSLAHCHAPKGACVQWHMQEGMLHLGWEEIGGPPVAPPTQKGFGSRVEEPVVRDLGGDTGVRC